MIEVDDRFWPAHTSTNSHERRLLSTAKLNRASSLCRLASCRRIRIAQISFHNLPPGGFFDVRGVKLPVGVGAFAEEIYQAPETWAKRAYVNLLYCD